MSSSAQYGLKRRAWGVWWEGKGFSLPFFLAYLNVAKEDKVNCTTNAPNALFFRTNPRPRGYPLHPIQTSRFLFSKRAYVVGNDHHPPHLIFLANKIRHLGISIFSHNFIAPLSTPLMMCLAVCQSQNNIQRFSLLSRLQENKYSLQKHHLDQTLYSPAFLNFFFSIFFFLSSSID